MQYGARYLLGTALFVAGLVAACGDAPNDSLGNDLRSGNGSNTVPGGSNGGTGNTNGGNSTGGPTPVDSSPTPNTEAKKFFVANVHPMLSQACGACHEAGPGPAWLKKADSEVSYKMMFQLGYVMPNSRIVLKGPHQGHVGTTPQQNDTFNQWVQMELASTGGKAAPNVLEKLGACFDKTTFDAMNLGAMRTVRRTGNNNTNQVTPWNENDDNCTGCDNSPCRTCHSGDDATGFVLAVGNPNLPATFTYDQSKLTNPTYLQKYFGVSATGEPIASNALKIKAEATQKDKAYTHPMFAIDEGLQGRIDAFVNATVTKYKAANGACTP